MATVLSRVVAACVTDPVALRESAVGQHVLRSRLHLAQGSGEPWRSAGEQGYDGTDVGVGGADADAETGRDLGEGGVLARSRSFGTRSTSSLQSGICAQLFTTWAGFGEPGWPVGRESGGRLGGPPFSSWGSLCCSSVLGF